MITTYKNLVEKKFSIYNGLFLSLPFKDITHTGSKLPILNQVCKKGLEKGEEPLQIIQQFLNQYMDLNSEKEEIDFLFRVIQYIERQIVLFDSIEDAAFPTLSKLSNDLNIDDFLHLIKTNNDQEILKKLNSFSVRLVFTAHPTQFYPPEVLEIINRLRGYISNNQIEKIDQTLQQLGLTSFTKRSKPTPLEEAKNIIYYLRNVYYDAISDFYSKVKTKLGKGVNFDNTNLIKIGFWPGGDRDGNPFVTAGVTHEVANELRMTLMKCYYRDLKDLENKLTFRLIQGPFNQLKDQVYQAMFHQDKFISYTEIISQLESIKSLLIEHYNSLFLHDLEEFIQKVHLFKTHFATLDIRQDHSVHQRTIEAVLRKNNLIDRELSHYSEEEIQELLQNMPSVNPMDYSDPLIVDTLTNITQLKEIQRTNGEEGLHRYIISNSEDSLSVLYVYSLFKCCGWKEEDLKFDIVPLFETMKGMKDAESTMNKLFNLPFYKNHLDRRKNTQTIMLGFSDGTKDGGYLKANWEIFQTKEKLTKACEDHHIKALFFDGRGGPPARGGGKTHRFYASLGEKIANHEIQLTIQGQTITSTYGTKEQFTYNSEQMLTAGLSSTINSASEFTNKHRELFDELAEISYKKYTALKQHKKFIPYLEEMSTLKYYAKANIGSRPAKRGKSKQLTLSDLRAISFVGSWSQLKQNVPGYYGLGTAFKQLKDQGRLAEIQDLYQKVPFFKALLLNSMMSLSKTYFALTAYMKKTEEFGDFWTLLNQEYELSKEMLLEVSGYTELMEEEFTSKRSIKIREQIVLPLLTIQQFALQKIATNPKEKETYEKMVMRSLYGNINASRNSA